MVISSKFQPLKRLHLATDVARLALVSYDVGTPREQWPMFGTLLNAEKDGVIESLNTPRLIEAYSSSRVGGILSAIEGACYSSGEYLLSGLPVVSTHSTGGRAVWYTVDNSVVVDATREAVAAGLAEALQRLQEGSFNRASIRRNAISLAKIHRARFVAHFSGILSEYEQQGNATAIFEGAFVHKMMQEWSDD